MADHEVTSPDGKRYIVTAPDGASQDEIIAYAQQQHRQTQEPPSNLAVAGNASAKAVAGLPDSVINAPTHLYNLGKAAFGMTAYALGYKDIGDSVTMTEPPSPVNKFFKQVGLISDDREPQDSNQRHIDAAVQGATTFLASPANGVKEVVKNAALGATSAVAGQATKEATDSPLAAITVAMLTPLAVRHGLNGLGKGATNEVLGETLKDGLQAGYVVPPSTIKASVVQNKIESVGGKSAIKQEAAIRNQEITNKLAAKAIGLPEDTTLTVGKLEAVREKAGSVYKEVENLTPPPGMPWFNGYHDTDRVQQLRQARADANDAWRHYERSADPAVAERAKAFSAKATSIEADLEKIAEANNRPDLVKQLAAARQEIAKTYEIERALNVSDGNVSARIIGRALDQGKPLTGELKTIGRFAQAFPSVTRDKSAIGSPNVSALDPVASAAFGAAGYAAGGPAGAVAAGAPLLRGPARTYLLSKGVQNRLINPVSGKGTALRSAYTGRSLAELYYGQPEGEQ